jgi:hypothetical protein
LLSGNNTTAFALWQIGGGGEAVLRDSGKRDRLVDIGSGCGDGSIITDLSCSIT